MPNMVPIIICGKRTEIATGVKNYLVPDYDVIHILTSVETANEDIPLLLSGKKPQNTTKNAGSQNYAQLPHAVVAGGGFTDEVFLAMKKVSDDTAGAEKVPWMRLDETRLRPGQSPDRGDGRQPPSEDSIDAFCKATAERVRAALSKPEVKGSGVFDY